MHTQTEFSKITPYIYLGTNACCMMHFKKQLLDLGIEADISLELEHLDMPEGVLYFLWLPTKDHTAPSMNMLISGVHFMEQLVAQKTKMYVHCKNGHGRAPTLVAAFLISQGMTVREAIDYIKKRRPEIHLEASQVKQLKLFEKKH